METKTLEYFKANAEELYNTTPIGVLGYISELESRISTPQVEVSEEAIEEAMEEHIGWLGEFIIDNVSVDEIKYLVRSLLSQSKQEKETDDEIRNKARLFASNLDKIGDYTMKELEYSRRAFFHGYRCAIYNSPPAPTKGGEG